MMHFYEAKLAGVAIWISSLSTSVGRTVVEHVPTIGDDTETDDRGQAPQRTRLELLFATLPGVTSPLERQRELVAKVEQGDPDGFWFTHPVLGTYRAAISDFEIGLRGTIPSATCTLVRKAVVVAVQPLGAGVSPVAGLEAVTVAGDAVTAELAAAELTSTVATTATEAVARWASGEAVPREVLLEVATITGQIQDEIARLELAADLQMWPAYKALVSLGASVRSAADAALSSLPRTFRLLVVQATALRALVARVYGSRLAAERYDQVIALNDVARPGRIPSNTTLVMPALSPAPRRY